MRLRGREGGKEGGRKKTLNEDTLLDLELNLEDVKVAP